ncbi:rhomboid family intramembrane serine protease [uncultured Secundilactobacillus sp.]|uniref:rhomboid family intramembrane serine protease n=1 Tax=uncultured Secundilactobacillus sp. TaxID=2813935 RepID=UPI00258A1A7F|nr:rhomboid family intramembrane serine protease [uncultured Secundilactobacillus sp.]
MKDKQNNQPVSEPELPEWYKNRHRPLRKFWSRFKGENWVTWAIMLLCGLGFILSYLAMTSGNLLSIATVFSALGWRGGPTSNWWGLLLNQFVQVSVMQLIFNLVFIYFVGQWLEPVQGHFRFLMTFLFAGVGGQLIAGYLSRFGLPVGMSTGSTTAVFGLLMVVVVEAFILKTGVNEATGRYASLLVIINLLLSFVLSGNYGVLSELCGLASGFIAAYLWPPLRARSAANLRTTILGSLVGVVLIGIAFIAG